MKMFNQLHYVTSNLKMPHANDDDDDDSEEQPSNT